MIYREEERDIFTLGGGFHLVQFIADDGTMAPAFRGEFDWLELDTRLLVGDCHQHGRIFSLVTRKADWDRATFKVLRTALRLLRAQALGHGITKLALRRDVDGLEWYRSRDILRETFQDTDIEIVVCK